METQVKDVILKVEMSKKDAHWKNGKKCALYCLLELCKNCSESQKCELSQILRKIERELAL